MPTQLTQEVASRALQDFFLEKPFVLFGTGTSCAVDRDFGMPALEAHLKREIQPPNNQQQRQWDDVLNHLKTNRDFEMAMNAIQDRQLLKSVIEKTAELVTKVDQKHRLGILKGTEGWPALGMFQRLVKGLPESDRTLHVATPNYDLLAEYAFTQANIPYTTGFCGGVVRELNWKQADREMTYPEKAPARRSKPKIISRKKKHIRLYKVHGSLNIFQMEHRVVETELWSTCPQGLERLMVTPGTSKYERLHEHRDSLLNVYDQALKEHSAFLFLGFGFNDIQLLGTTMKSKLKHSPVLILTRDMNPRIQDMLDSYANTWLVCKDDVSHFARVHSSKHKASLLWDSEIWQFDLFVRKILGD